MTLYKGMYDLGEFIKLLEDYKAKGFTKVVFVHDGVGVTYDVNIIELNTEGFFTGEPTPKELWTVAIYGENPNRNKEEEKQDD